MLKNVKNTTYPGLLSLIAPHSCRGCGQLGEVLCPHCQKYINRCNFNKCPNCKRPYLTNNHKCQHCHNLPPVFIIDAREGLLATLIHDYKYNSVRAIGAKLAECLHMTLPPKLPNNSIIVPLPTATNHIRSRGFDHTLFIAKRLAKLRHLPIQKILVRNKNTVQVGTDKKTRLIQASSAYTLSDKIKISPSCTYILVDDVWTTGASMLSAVEKLRSAGAPKIIIALLAISLLDH